MASSTSLKRSSSTPSVRSTSRKTVVDLSTTGSVTIKAPIEILSFLISQPELMLSLPQAQQDLLEFLCIAHEWRQIPVMPSESEEGKLLLRLFSDEKDLSAPVPSTDDEFHVKKKTKKSTIGIFRLDRASLFQFRTSLASHHRLRFVRLFVNINAEEYLPARHVRFDANTLTISCPELLDKVPSATQPPPATSSPIYRLDDYHWEKLTLDWDGTSFDELTNLRNCSITRASPTSRQLLVSFSFEMIALLPADSQNV